jgi:GTP diphosphokinase / guanosine-3',5'-bis(diphosphate) 3'-diphosphatase
MSAPSLIGLPAILSALRDQRSETRRLVEDAWHFACEAHGDQKRLSGESHFEGHVVLVAYYLAEAGMDAPTVAAALLHDVLEDTTVTREAVQEKFGDEIVFLVEGVTKLGKLKYRGLERHVESLRRLLVATASDIRVVIIKLYDRLHNMQTNHFHPIDRQKRKAIETMEVYVPIAERLGIGHIKTQLEDLAFKTLEPEKFTIAQKYIEDKRKELEQKLDEDIKDIKKFLAESNLKKFRTEYRFKSVYSFHKKLGRKEGVAENIYDVIALRVIVPEVNDCYIALAILHRLWRPLPGRVKDFIAAPKPNGYQSLHSTVITRRGITLEVQIRTEAMHREAEFGIASHFNYKTGQKKGSTVEWLGSVMPTMMRFTKKEKEASAPIPQWLKDLTEAQKEHPDHETFEEILKQDFFAERMFVFTPKGDVIDLPLGATPIDFAYAIHSDIGDTALGAKVDGKMSVLHTPLVNGNVVEIITRKTGKPNKKWLDFVKTAKAKEHIKNALREKE